MLFENQIRGFIRKHRRARPLKATAHLAERYLNAWYNTGFWDFERNGERFVLNCLAKVMGGRPLEVWDVGAHNGEYAYAVHQALPAAKVVSFEIMPALCAIIQKRRLDPKWFTLRETGLSDSEGTVEVSWNLDSDSTNTIRPSREMASKHRLERVTCPITTIDRLIAEGAPPPDFLKIDVEGHDAAVIKGAKDLLTSPHAPMLIQFEYGGTWLPSGSTLYETHGLLDDCGYSVGRLYPDHVGFKAYDMADDRFRMGNMVATRSADLKAALS